MDLILVRHGESTWNAERRLQGWGDPPLSARGRAQAQLLGQRLQEYDGLDGLYSSTLCRAKETAEIVGHLIGIQPQLDERLREHGIGILTGLTSAEVENHHTDLWHRRQTNAFWTPVPGEERHEAFRLRVTSAIEEIESRHHDSSRVAIVSHGGTFGVYLMDLLKMDMRRRQPFSFSNASISIIRTGGTHPRLVLLNDRCHLQGMDAVTPS